MTDAPYGYCPVCGAPGEIRERRPLGNDRCPNGHTYPSGTARSDPPRTAADERADVLAYIERAIAYPFPSPPVLGPEAYLTALYDYIAAGAHEGHAARKKP